MVTPTCVPMHELDAWHRTNAHIHTLLHSARYCDTHSHHTYYLFSTTTNIPTIRIPFGFHSPRLHFFTCIRYVSTHLHARDKRETHTPPTTQWQTAHWHATAAVQPRLQPRAPAAPGQPRPQPATATGRPPAAHQSRRKG